MKKFLSILIIFIFIAELFTPWLGNSTKVYADTETDSINITDSPVVISTIGSIDPTGTIDAINTIDSTTDNAELGQALDSLSLNSMISDFQDNINTYTLQKNQLLQQTQTTTQETTIQEITTQETIDQINNIDENINSYSNILSLIENNNITDDDINASKNLVHNLLNGSSTTDSLTCLSYTDILAVVLDCIAIGDTLGYHLAANLLAHSVCTTTNSTYNIWNTDPLVTSRVKASAYYKHALSTLRIAYREHGTYNYSTTFNLEFKGQSGNIVETDMYYGIHKCNPNCSLNVTKGYANLVLNDVYDFPALAFPTNFSTLLNDIGKIAVSHGVCHIYYVKIHTVESFYSYIPTPWPGYYYQYGSTGSNVTKIQNRLNLFRFSCGTADGIFGSMTKSAVIKFQISRGLVADGVVGPITWNRLFNL